MSGAKIICTDICFTDLSYTVNASNSKSKKIILNQINGRFKAGKLSAIMGPSGAGKSSLMHILTGFEKKGVSGNINFGENDNSSNKICCYVLQEDFFFPLFTVKEAMLLAASLKISDDVLTLDKRKVLIEEILQSLSLSDCKRTKCGSLSGGQKKRLSIALELIDNPRVIFLDEPTTGLDCSSAMGIVQLLKDLSNEGRTVVCTIHQPSAIIYLLFDHIYVLDRGLCVYQGSPKNTTKFLESVGVECPAYHNPADVLLEVTTGEYGDYTASMIESAKNRKWLTHYDLRKDKIEDHSNEIISVKLQRIYPPNEIGRFQLLLGRCRIQYFRDWTMTYLKVVLHVIAGTLTGILIGPAGNNAAKALSNANACSAQVIYLWYTAVMPGILRFPLEMATIRKEVFNKWYKTKTYYLAAAIVSVPIHIFYSSIYTSLVYFITSQPLEIDRYLKYIFANVVFSIVADAFGTLVGTLANPVNGTFIGVVLSCFMFMFSGVFIFFADMSPAMKYISYLSPHRLAFESLVFAILSDNRSNMICPDEEVYCHFKNPKFLLSILGIAEESSFALNILLLLAQYCLFKIVGYFCLNRALKGAN